MRGGAPPAPDPQPQGLQSPRISPLPQPPSPGDANPQRSGRGRVTRRGPGAKTAEACRAPGPEARCSRLARRRSPQPAAASPAAPAASSRRSPRPAVTGGRWRGSRGGAGRIQAPSDPAGERGRARRRPESQASAGACAARRARVRIPGESAWRLRSRAEAPPARRLAPDAWWPRPPPSSRRKVQCGGSCWGSPSPGRLSGSAAEPLPFRLGGHQPRALSGRPGQENHREGGRGKAAGGFRTR